MISLKLVGIVAAAFVAGTFFSPPVQEAIAAVIATDVQCTGCVGTPDLGSNAVTSVKIKDGEVKTEDIALNAIGSARIKDNDVKAQDLAPDSVGASELQGVSKLIFSSCTVTFPSGGGIGTFSCPVTGARVGDRVIATVDTTYTCGNGPLLRGAHIYSSDIVSLTMEFNTTCGSNSNPVQIIVFR